MNLTHVDSSGKPRMVDVGDKPSTQRTATASGIITMSSEALEAALSGSGKKGAVIQTAVVAAVMGTKQTAMLIPMCHPLGLSSVDCEIEELSDVAGLRLWVTATLHGQTGVEMEALTGVSIGLLTIYDMLKAIDKSMQISDIRLEKKTGGKSGDYHRVKPA